MNQVNADDGRVGCLGKIPSEADYVRRNIGARVGSEFDRWLVQSIQNLTHSKVELPEAPVRLVFSAPEVDSVVVAVLQRSQDLVGRSFPLAIYTSCPLSEASYHYAALPLVYGSFLSDAESLLEAASVLSVSELYARVAALRAPDPGLLSLGSEKVLEVLRTTSPATLFERAFGPQPAGAHAYAAQTFLTATEGARAGVSGPPTVLACPLAIDVDLLAWLDLCRRCLGWRDQCPAFAWTEDPEQPRLLLALGNASQQLLHFVAQPGHDSARLWPLTTPNAQAVARAQDLFAPQIWQGANLDTLWTQLSGRQS